MLTSTAFLPAARRRKNPVRREQTLQQAVAKFLTVALRPPTLWSAIGHGGGGALRGAILKGMGVKAGLPDVLILHPVHGAHTVVLGLELKAGKGKPSPAQEDMAHHFHACNAGYVICRSIEDVELALAFVGIPFRAKTFSSATRHVAMVRPA